MKPLLVIGSETQGFEGSTLLTGIQRVVRETHMSLFDRLTPQGVAVVPLHTRPEPRLQDYRDHHYFAGDPVLDQRARGVEEVDVICLLDMNLRTDFTSLYRAQRTRRRPVVAVVYDLIPLVASDTVPEHTRAPFRLYIQQVLALADHVIVTCQKVREDIEALSWSVRGQISVLHLGSSFRPEGPRPQVDERLSMIYVSTIEPRKGHMLLLEAFDLLRSAGIDVDLTLVGRAGWAEEATFRAIIGHPDFGGRLKWLQEPSDAQLLAAVRRCSIGVFPSREEGFGLFVEEGLSLGLKMVVSDLPVFRERHQPNLSYHGPTAQELAEAVLTAHAAPWTQPPRAVRTMAEFADDLAQVLLGAHPGR